MLLCTAALGLAERVAVLERGTHHAVVYKPGGMACHRSAFVGKQDVHERFLLQEARDLLGCRINLVHRLDRGSSGCVLVALDDGDGETGALSASLTAGRKTYFAFCRGSGQLLRAHAT